VRLVGGTNTRGRLEVLRNGIWGTVCDYHFNTAAASVVCNMLGIGYSTMTVVYIIGLQSINECNGIAADKSLTCWIS